MHHVDRVDELLLPKSDVHVEEAYRKLTGRGLTDGTAQPQKIK